MQIVKGSFKYLCCLICCLIFAVRFSFHVLFILIIPILSLPAPASPYILPKSFRNAHFFNKLLLLS